MDDALDSLAEPIDDDVLRLTFVCCHPVLPVEGQIAPSERLLGGLTTREIARAFLVAEPPWASGSPAPSGPCPPPGSRSRSPARAAPRTPDRCARRHLPDLQRGLHRDHRPHWARPDLCEEALRLGRMLAAPAPDDPEVHALVALTALQASRLTARVDVSGAAVLLPAQDRMRWDRLLIARGLAAPVEAGGQPVGAPSPGAYGARDVDPLA